MHEKTRTFSQVLCFFWTIQKKKRQVWATLKTTSRDLTDCYQSYRAIWNENWQLEVRANIYAEMIQSLVGELFRPEIEHENHAKWLKFEIFRTCVPCTNKFTHIIVIFLKKKRINISGSLSPNLSWCLPPGFCIGNEVNRNRIVSWCWDSIIACLWKWWVSQNLCKDFWILCYNVCSWSHGNHGGVWFIQKPSWLCRREIGLCYQDDIQHVIIITYYSQMKPV